MDQLKMTRYAKIKIRMALIGTLLIVIMMTGVVAMFGLYYTDRQNTQDQNELQTLYEEMDQVRAVQLHFKRQVQEWKNILLRGNRPEDFLKYSELFRQEQRRTANLLQTVNKSDVLNTSERLEELADRLHTLNQRYNKALSGFNPARATSIQTTDDQVRGMDRPLEKSLDNLVQKLEAEVSVQQEEARKAEQHRYKIFRNVLVTFSAIGCLLGLALLPDQLRKKSNI
jgi:hypothetical protein